jgi:hypothetical protein
MTSTDNLRLKAAKCRKLGMGLDAKTTLTLSSMADEYDAEALAIDVAAAAAAKLSGAEH